MLDRISAFWAKVEMALAAWLAMAVSALILLNVVTRTAGAALFWVDELAVYAMVWMTFFAASAAIHHRQSVSVTLLQDLLPARGRARLSRAVDAVVFGFAVFMLWVCWRWYLPLDFARAGFDVSDFQSETFNFIYSEPTTTLGIPKAYVWSVMWLFAIGATLHSLANLFRAPAEGTLP
ncbi:TRAP transporter small permease subunit [Stappia sp.]|uniref:TRAP transporter small permease n=1 Tax=Stappia sp. TaxID=1870903 RepID=UPI0032D8CE20